MVAVISRDFDGMGQDELIIALAETQLECANWQIYCHMLKEEIEKQKQLIRTLEEELTGGP